MQVIPVFLFHLLKSIFLEFINFYRILIWFKTLILSGITMFVNLVDEVELRRLDPYYSSYLPRVRSLLTEEPQINPKITANTIKYLHFPIKGKD